MSGAASYRRRSGLSALLGALLLVAFLVAVPPEPARADHSCVPAEPPIGAVDCSGGHSNEGGPGDDGDSGDSGDSGEPQGPQPVDIYMTPACSINTYPPNDPGVMCMGATASCETQGEEGSIMMRVYYLWEEGGDWELVDTRCEGGDTDEEQVVLPTPDEIRWELESRVLPRAPLQTSPANGETVVQLPTIFYTDVEDPWERTVDIVGTPMTITASPARFVWYPTGRGGESFTATRQGVQYQESRDFDDYVTYEYETAGTYDVALDVVWEASYSVAGGPQNQSLGEITVPGDGTVQVTAHEMGSVLIR